MVEEWATTGSGIKLEDYLIQTWYGIIEGQEREIKVSNQASYTFVRFNQCPCKWPIIDITIFTDSKLGKHGPSIAKIKMSFAIMKNC